jgi:hypothetical protein
LECKQFLKEIVKELHGHHEEEEIVSALDRVCSRLLATDRHKCEAFIDQYHEELIHILPTDSNPELICSLIGIC